MWFCSRGGCVCLSACWDTTHPPQQPPPRSRHTPPGEQTPAYGQRPAGTHPTRMHSCLIEDLSVQIFDKMWKWFQLLVCLQIVRSLTGFSGVNDVTFILVWRDAIVRQQGEDALRLTRGNLKYKQVQGEDAQPYTKQQWLHKLTWWSSKSMRSILRSNIKVTKIVQNPFLTKFPRVFETDHIWSHNWPHWLITFSCQFPFFKTSCIVQLLVFLTHRKLHPVNIFSKLKLLLNVWQRTDA